MKVTVKAYKMCCTHGISIDTKLIKDHIVQHCSSLYKKLSGFDNLTLKPKQNNTYATVSNAYKKIVKMIITIIN